MINELPHEKTNNVAFEQVRHEPACTVIEDGLRLEIFGFRKVVEL